MTAPIKFESQLVPGKPAGWNMLGASLAYASNMIGISLACAWNMHGLNIVYAWSELGICLGYARNKLGICLAYASYSMHTKSGTALQHEKKRKMVKVPNVRLT